ncbi:MAG: glycosyltransferase family 4 protein [Candidatus Heimdallarchaeota archaeon]
MEKLNICLVSLTFAPDTQDGAAKFFTGIYNYLKMRGHNVKVITGKWNNTLTDPNIFQANIITKRFLWFPQFNLKVVKFLKSQDFDIIHGNSPKGVLPIILSNQKRFISTIHDLGPFETSFTRIPFEKVMIKLAVNRSTYITTCSNFIRKEIKYYIPQVDIASIFNLYSAIEDKYKPHPEEAKKLKQDLQIDGPIVLYIGRIAKYKGVDDIIEAYKIAKKEIPKLNLVMGGKPDFYMEKTYQEWKQKYKDIHFVGFVSEKEIPIFYSMGDIFVTYSYASEGFGLTPIEAIACGTPVICSSMIAYKEVLKDNAIFVSPKNPQQLAKEIVNLLKDNSRKERLIEKAQNFIKRYSWDSVGKKLENIYYKFLRE